MIYLSSTERHSRVCHETRPRCRPFRPGIIRMDGVRLLSFTGSIGSQGNPALVAKPLVFGVISEKKHRTPKDEFTSCVLGGVRTKDHSLCLALASKQWDRWRSYHIHTKHHLRVILRVKWVYQSKQMLSGVTCENPKRHVHIHLSLPIIESR